MGKKQTKDPFESGALEMLFDEERIALRVRELGAELSRDYDGEVPLLVSVLKGSVLFFGDLVRAMSIPLHMDFMAISNFESAGSEGAVRITKDLDTEVSQRHVVIVEDIIDTGLTAGYLVRSLLARKPASLKICTLLDRKVRRLVELPLEYVGFEVPDSFLVGYGLDYRQTYRNLPWIARVPDEILENAEKSLP
jgi:hypoxanthine phosphoribosyltransferase